MKNRCICLNFFSWHHCQQYFCHICDGKLMCISEESMTVSLWAPLSWTVSSLLVIQATLTRSTLYYGSSERLDPLTCGGGFEPMTLVLLFKLLLIRPVALFTKHLTIEISLKRKLTSTAYFTKTLTMIVSEIFLVTLRVPKTTRKFNVSS